MPDNIPHYEIATDLYSRAGYVTYRATSVKGVRAAGTFSVQMGTHRYERREGSRTFEVTEPAVYVYFSPDAVDENGSTRYRDGRAHCDEPFLVNGRTIHGDIRVEFYPDSDRSHRYSNYGTQVRTTILGVPGALHATVFTIRERTPAGHVITDALAEAVAREMLTDVNVLTYRLTRATDDRRSAYTAKAKAVAAVDQADARVAELRMALDAARDAAERSSK